VPYIDCQHPSPISFGTGNDRRIRKPQGQIVVSANQISDSGDVRLGGLESVRPLFDILKKGVEDVTSERFEQLRDFREDCLGYEPGLLLRHQSSGDTLVIRVCSVGHGNHR